MITFSSLEHAPITVNKNFMGYSKASTLNYSNVSFTNSDIFSESSYLGYSTYFNIISYPYSGTSSNCLVTHYSKNFKNIVYKKNINNITYTIEVTCHYLYTTNLKYTNRLDGSVQNHPLTYTSGYGVIFKLKDYYLETTCCLLATFEPTKYKLIQG